jgi:pimeloyl-ACP methyl ester carboxylesterase
MQNFLLFIACELIRFMHFIKKNTTISINQRSFSVQTIQPAAGQKFPFLVFLHHALGSIAQWKDFPEELAKMTELPAVLIERLGHGRSGEMDSAPGQDHFHKEAFEKLPLLLNELGIQRPFLIGHSDGATIALLYASRFPVAGVIAEAPHIQVEEQTLEGIRQSLRKKGELSSRMEKYHGKKAERLISAWSEMWLAPSFREWNIERELKQISAPVMVVQGTDDPYGSMSHLEGILRALRRRSCAFIVPGCGHFPHAEARVAVLERMAGFIDYSITHHTT